MMFVRGGAQGGLLQRAWAEVAGQRRVCAACGDAAWQALHSGCGRLFSSLRTLETLDCK
jgi:hypothetical protein